MKLFGGLEIAGELGPAPNPPHPEFVSYIHDIDALGAAPLPPSSSFINLVDICNLGAPPLPPSTSFLNLVESCNAAPSAEINSSQNQIGSVLLHVHMDRAVMTSAFHVFNAVRGNIPTKNCLVNTIKYVFCLFIHAIYIK